MSGTSPIALGRTAVPQQVIGTGMISPANAFVSPATGQLTGLSFRFLFDVANAVNGQLDAINALNTSMTQVQGQVATLNGEMAAANANIATLQGQVSTLNGQVTTINGQIAALQAEDQNLQGQINTINNRLAAAGIP